MVLFRGDNEEEGFRERWINLVMGCVKIVSYSVLVNGDPCGMIFPTRGIRQRDPFPIPSLYGRAEWVD